jgi:iron complex transport system ATP-binding protein
MTPLVEVRDVAFAYAPRRGRSLSPLERGEGEGRSGTAFALHGLSFAIERGEIFGLIGPNASGKTTITRLLSRVLSPRAGEIRVDGQPLERLSRAEVARAVAVVPQDVPAGFLHTVEALVLMGRFPHAPRRLFETDDDVAHAREAMAALGILELRGERVDRLSGGERQRVLLARAFAQRAPLLVLDEPTAHLDLRFQAECVGVLRRLNRDTGQSVLLVSHDLNLAAEVCDRLLLLGEGRIAGVGPVEAVLEERLLERVYGCRVVVDKHPATGRPTVQVVWPTA